MAVVLLIVGVVFVSSASALDPHQLELKQHYEHLAYIADFTCLHPQPKVISVHNLFSESQAHGKAYFPDVTVLYRCDDCTGSCTSGHVCKPKTTKLVLLPFKATYLQNSGKFKKGSWQMEYHELMNHTECACAIPPPHDSSHNNNMESHMDTSAHKPGPAGPSSAIPVSDNLGGSSHRPGDNNSPSSHDSSLLESSQESTTVDIFSVLIEKRGS